VRCRGTEVKANEYTSFDGGVNAALAAVAGQERVINQIDETSFTITKASDLIGRSTTGNDLEGTPPAHFYPQTN
jgi:hypothetical protein